MRALPHILAFLLALPLAAAAQSVPSKQGCLGCTDQRRVVARLTGDEEHLYRLAFDAGDKMQVAIQVKAAEGFGFAETGPRFDLLEPGTERLLFQGETTGPYAELTAPVGGDYGVRVYLTGPERNSGSDVTYWLIAD